MALVPFSRPGSDADPDDDLDPDAPERGEDGGGAMSFLDHLDELRRRIIWAVASLAAGFLICCFFIQQIFDFIMRPLQQMLPNGGTLVYTDPSEAFILYIKLAAIGGLILSSPAIFTQLWLFIAPGLYSQEKKWAIPFVMMSSFFFVAGAAFSHYIVFPLTWRFFVGFTTDYLTFMPRIEPAFSMYLRLLLSFGVVFQMPTMVLFLARMGMLTPRFMIKNIKYAFLIIIIVSAVITPDGGGVSLIAMSGPLFVLYLFSIGLAWMFGKPKQIAD
ncbi:MAG: twin-arginine translocase subunit TatC [Acidobacteria bacterium]|nr:twin-arginine translocase subunit TatC [Acidobacteriota bacterium]